MTLISGNKKELVEACDRFKLKLKQVRSMILQADLDHAVFDAAFIKSAMTRGEGGRRSFFDISNQELLGLSGKMKSKIIGQDHAVDKVCDAIIKRRIQSQNALKPIGSFLLPGPTGTGKTWFAKILNRLLYLADSCLIFMDFSTYKHQGDVSQIYGAPPGYIGHKDEGGFLARQVRQIKSGILLFDEIDKAHPEVLDALLRMVDEGKFMDASTGETIGISEFVIIMTTNLGTREAADEPDPIKFEETILNVIKSTLKPEFINRFDDILVFHPLTQRDCCQIAGMLLKESLEKIGSGEIKFDYTEKLIDEIVIRGYDPVYNARELGRTIDRMIINPISPIILKGMIKLGDRILLDWGNGDLRVRRSKSLSNDR